MIIFVDLPTLWKRIGRGFWVESKMNCQRFNITVIIVDFLRHEKFTVRGVVLNLTVICQRCNFELDKNWFLIGAILRTCHSIDEN